MPIKAPRDSWEQGGCKDYVDTSHISPRVTEGIFCSKNFRDENLTIQSIKGKI